MTPSSAARHRVADRVVDVGPRTPPRGLAGPLVIGWWCGMHRCSQKNVAGGATDRPAGANSASPPGVLIEPDRVIERVAVGRRHGRRLETGPLAMRLGSCAD